MEPMNSIHSIHSIEALILKDEALRYRTYHTGYIVLLSSLAAMMIVGGIFLFLLPELEQAGIALVFASVLVGVAYMTTLKVRGIVGAASEIVLRTNEQRKAALIEILVRGALFAVFMTVFTWFSDNEATPAKLAFTGILNFVFWSLGMYAYYVIRSKRNTTQDASEGGIE